MKGALELADKIVVLNDSRDCAAVDPYRYDVDDLHLVLAGGGPEFIPTLSALMDLADACFECVMDEISLALCGKIDDDRTDQVEGADMEVAPEDSKIGGKVKCEHLAEDGVDDVSEELYADLSRDQGLPVGPGCGRD